MSFKEQLERQLFQAAERERQPLARWRPGRLARRARPRLAPALATASALAAVAGALVLATGDDRSVRPTLTTPVRPQVKAGPQSGTYVGARQGGEQARLLVLPGAYQLRAPQLYLYGTLYARGDTLEFVRPPGNSELPPGLSRADRDDCLLPRADGVYRWSQSRQSLRLVAIDDPCDPRRRVLDGARLQLRDP